MRDEGAVERLFARAVAAFGRIDLLFNNAGLFPRGLPIDELPVEDWQDAVATNLTGPFLYARASFVQMKRQSPRG